MTADLGELVRADFPVLSRRIDDTEITYLDSAATSLKPQAVIDAVARYYSQIGANIHRGKHYLSEEASDHYERVRYRMGQFLGVPSNEVVFVANATSALNLVAAGLELTPDDVVLGTLDAHHSNLVPWRRSARVELVRPGRAGTIDLDHYRALLGVKPKVVALTHCSNVTGAYAPLADMIPLAKEAGATVVVDAAQSAPHRRLDLAGLGADFVALSGHKMLAPTGTGVLWGRHDALLSLRPIALGGGTVDWVDRAGESLRKVPHRFEAGTPNIAGIYGLGAALDYLERVGHDALEAHDRELARRMLDQAARRPWMRVLGGVEGERAAIMSVAIEGFERLSDVARILSDSYGVMCRTGHLCAQPLVADLAGGEVLRISAYFYNTYDDIRRVMEALDEIRESFGLDGSE